MNGIDESCASDLIARQIFSTNNREIRYLLTEIDTFSKFVWIVPSKRKTGQGVANALAEIFKDHRPNKLWVDDGREYYNKNVQKLIDIYFMKNEEKYCVVKRFNRTI